MAEPTLKDLMAGLKDLAQNQSQLLSEIHSVSQRVTDIEKRPTARGDGTGLSASPALGPALPASLTHTPPLMPADAGTQSPVVPASPEAKSGFTSRIILTTYPKQIGIKPLPMDWGAKDPQQRGPVTVSRVSSTIRRRNAIGAHSGSYSIYYALAVASKELPIDHKPDFTNTEPAVNIGPFPQWADKKKIVAMDPWGHLVPWTFKDIMDTENGDPAYASTLAYQGKCRG